MAEMTDKQGDKIIALINKLIEIAPKKNGSDSGIGNSNTKDDDGSALNKILEKQAGLTKLIANDLKQIEDRNKKILKIESRDVKLEEQRAIHSKKLLELETARTKSMSTLNQKEQQIHKAKIKDLEKEAELEGERLDNLRHISLAQKRIKDAEAAYYKKNKKEIDDKIAKEAKIEAKKEKSKERKERVESVIEDKKRELSNKMQRGFIDTLMDSVKSLLEQDSIMSKLSANYSLTREESGALKRNILDASIQTAVLGVKTEDLVKMQSTYTDELGRSVMLGEKGMISLANMGVATGLGVEGAAKMASSMELFGLSAEGATDEIQNLIIMSRKSGVSTSVMSKKLQENFKIANSYTFKDGVSGVEKMTVYSSKFRINMQSIAGFADKVSNPEGAITAAASLQVLGGSFAQMADPMKMLNQGINDMEGLTETYNKMLNGLGKVNKETGEVTIGGYDRLRIKAAAEAMGVSFDEMMETVRTKAKRKAIEADLEINPQLKGDEQSKDLVASLAQFNQKDHRYEIEVGGKTKSIASLSKQDIETLRPRNTELNVNTIAQNTLGLTELLRNSFNMLLQTMMPMVIKGLNTLTGWVLKGVNWLTGFMNGNPDDNSPEAVAGRKKRTNMVGGTTMGVLAGGATGAAIGSLILPVGGTIIGGLAGAAIGGLLGLLGGTFASANDGIYDGKTGTFTQLNSKDQIVAMKQGGALSEYGSPVANSLFGAPMHSSNIQSNIKPNNIYSGVSNGYSNTYNRNTSNYNNGGGQTNGNIKLNLEGNINLTGSNGSATKISASELIKDRNFVRELTRIIGNQMNRDKNGGKFVGGLNNNSF